MRECYYGVAGRNGFGVYIDFEKIEKSRVYIQGIRISQENSWDEAFEWARNMYFAIAPDVDQYYVPIQGRINWFNHRKKYQRGVIYEI